MYVQCSLDPQRPLPPPRQIHRSRLSDMLGTRESTGLSALPTHGAHLSTLALHSHTPRPAPTPHTHTPHVRSLSRLFKIEGQWENRCHWLYRVLMFLTCGLFGGRGIRQTDFEQLARIMARIFHTEVRVCVRVCVCAMCFVCACASVLSCHGIVYCVRITYYTVLRGNITCG